jgi:hypothetical protein
VKIREDWKLRNGGMAGWQSDSQRSSSDAQHMTNMRRLESERGSAAQSLLVSGETPKITRVSINRAGRQTPLPGERCTQPQPHREMLIFGASCLAIIPTAADSRPSYAGARINNNTVLCYALLCYVVLLVVDKFMLRKSSTHPVNPITSREEKM